MSKKIEAIPDAGLKVFRGGLDPDLAQAFEAECAALLSDTAQTAQRRNNKGEVNPDRVFSYDFSTDRLGQFRAIGQVLKMLGKSHGHRAMINYQAPHSAGDFHKAETSVKHPSVLVQASDDGLFDYVTGDARTDEEAQARATSVPVGAGDILVQYDPNLVHRGQNPSDHPRYNMVIWEENAPLSLEAAIRESAHETWE